VPDRDSVPDFTALMDQARAETKQTANVIATHYIALTEAGVPEYEALRLTLAFQRRFVFGTHPDTPLDQDAE